MFINEITQQTKTLRDLNAIESLDSLNDPSLSNLLILVHKLNKQVYEALETLKAEGVRRQLPTFYNFEEGMKVSMSNGKSKTVVDVSKVYNDLNTEELQMEFFKACTLVKDRMQTQEFIHIVGKYSEIIPGDKNTITSISPITKQEMILMNTGQL